MGRRKARRRSWGSVTEVKRGRKYVLRWVENTPQGRRRKTETFYGTYKQADKRLNDIRHEREQPPVPTVGQLWEKYKRPEIVEAVAAGTCSKGTLAGYDAKWRRHVGPRWAHVPANQVRPMDVQEWLLTLTRSGGRICRAVLKVTLDYAVLFELIATNPAAKKFRYGADTSRNLGVYSPEQLQRAWEAVRGGVAEAPFLLSAFAGLRVGEACGLKLADVESFEGYAALSVSTQATLQGDAAAALKTRSSRRRVALLAPYSERLREIIGAHEPHAVYVNDDGTGAPVGRKAVYKAWKAQIEATGLPYLPMQTLRPAFETALHWRGGIEIEKVARILGHTQPTTTLGYYDRPEGDELVRVLLEQNPDLG